MATKRTVISQLASVGEEALGRIVQNPVTHRAREGAVQIRDRVEKLVLGLTGVEDRVARLEERVDRLEQAKRAPAKRAAPSSQAKGAGSEPSPPEAGG
jgi:hypothetical protein